MTHTAEEGLKYVEDVDQEVSSFDWRLHGLFGYTLNKRHYLLQFGHHSYGVRSYTSSDLLTLDSERNSIMALGENTTVLRLDARGTSLRLWVVANVY